MHIHIDMVGGLAGDMFLAAAIDAQLIDIKDLEENLRTLGLGTGIEIVVEQVRRGALSGSHVHFKNWDPDADSDHRHLSTIEKMIADSELSPNVKAQATKLFRRLGESESKVHDIPMERVHFHEVGAVDSILDFCSAAYIIEHAQATWSFGPVPMGHGSIETAHGTIPVPAPATADLLIGLETVERDVQGELVTPTGAAILAGLESSPRPAGTIEKIGYGAGTKEFGDLSNVVRFMVLDAETTPGLERDTITRLECELDDMTAEALAFVETRLLDLGALDVVRTAVQMKKGRLGTRLTVLAPSTLAEKLYDCLFRETSTLGVRIDAVERVKMPRRFETVPTQYGDVSMKVALLNGEPLKAAPEFEDCARLAKEHEVPLNTIFEAAIAAWNA